MKLTDETRRVTGEALTPRLNLYKEGARTRRAVAERTDRHRGTEPRNRTREVARGKMT